MVPGYKAKILVVDDEIGVLKAISTTLKKEGFEVESAKTGQIGIDIAEKSIPDLILLDLRLPDMDGYDVCQLLKKGKKTASIPIIMVTTRAQDTEKVVGLQIGADDYITKPYNPLELVARVRAMLRRGAILANAQKEPSKILRYGSVEVNLDIRNVTVSSKKIKLPPKEYELLIKLLARPGKVFSRDSLMASIWGHSYESLHGTVDHHIACLRKKMGPASQWIETVSGIGYCWAEEEVN